MQKKGNVMSTSLSTDEFGLLKENNLKL